MPSTLRKVVWRMLIIAGVVFIAGVLVWLELRPEGLGDGFASGNGRIEATEIDIATKQAGRIEAVLVGEGEQVEPNQLLARMDTKVLEAELGQARAQVRQAESARRTAQAQVAQRQSEKTAAEAVVLQRDAELSAAHKRYDRTRALVARNALSRQQLDDDLASLESTEAALAAARAGVLSALAAIEAADSKVIESQAAIEAASATVDKLEADLEDSQLRSDRVARVQYRVAQPGEVLPAGGVVLNLVDLTDVYMTFFLPERQAGRVALGADVYLVLDAAPQYVIQANVSYVSSVAQFTPKTVETASEREKLMFRVKARIDPALLEQHLDKVKTGLPGMAYLKLDDTLDWPDELKVNVTP
ncbi:HlyD family secretion protein [Vreelandella arctica]|uniref:HlyD family secretion protein n=1 Tax=Halomonadaceae TaxID=28256 RepID=UPI001E35D319|nr:HlyD family efflux transporter periplasmic adaptor subunit [Halomonas sp. MES3-P3E]